MRDIYWTGFRDDLHWNLREKLNKEYHFSIHTGYSQANEFLNYMQKHKVPLIMIGNMVLTKSKDVFQKYDEESTETARELIRQIRTNSLNTKTPILAFAHEEDQEVINAGADAILPIFSNHDELCAIIQQHFIKKGV